DGIRDFHVTGVQTCALPIFVRLFGFLFIVFQVAAYQVVGNLGGVVQHGTTTFRDRFLGQQHAAYIGVVDDGVGHLIRLFFARQQIGRASCREREQSGERAEI